MSQDGLTQHINTLSDTLLSPWMMRASFKPVLEDVEKLVGCMNKYRSYLADVASRMNVLHHSLNPARTPSDHMMVVVHEASVSVPDRYQPLLESLGDVYEPVHLEEFIPEDRFERRQWLQLDSVEKETDKEHRALLTAARVRDFLFCSECSKPRCVYAAARLTSDEDSQVQLVKNEGTYTCGVSLFPTAHSLRYSVIVKEALKCSSLVEAAYYSSPRVCFEACCVYCGTVDDLVDDEQVRDTRKRYHTVRPICGQCKLSKNLITRGPKNFNAKKNRNQT